MGLDFEEDDWVALRGARSVIEGSSLPNKTMQAFREWLAKDMFVRGKGNICDHFFSVLNKEKCISEDMDVMFAVYVTARFPQFLVSAAGIECISELTFLLPPVKREALVKPSVRVPSACGPALPPKLAARLVAEGHVLGSYEDPNSDAWLVEVRRVGVVDGGPDAVETPELVSVCRLEDAPCSVADWGDSSGAFHSAAVAAIVDGTLSRTPRKDSRKRVAFKDPDKRTSSGVRAGPPDQIYGPKALLLEVDWGGVPPQRECTLGDVLKFAADKRRCYEGEVELLARYQSGRDGPIPVRWFVRRKDGSGLRPRDLLGAWRGKDAPIDWGPMKVR
jgi:hypothetical protein